MTALDLLTIMRLNLIGLEDSKIGYEQRKMKDRAKDCQIQIEAIKIEIKALEAKAKQGK